MKQVAIMIDAGFFKKKFQEKNSNKFPYAKHIIEFSKKCIEKDEELFRVYYYDCPPFDKEIKQPVSKTPIDYSKSKAFEAANRFQQELAKSDYIAFRKGSLSFEGWAITDGAIQDLMTASRTLVDSDFKLIFKQKRVDIKIGLDVAWLSSKRIVDRIILVAGDYDFEPVIKFARKEGIQVVLVTLNHTTVKKELREHCDIFRSVEIPTPFAPQA